MRLRVFLNGAMIFLAILAYLPAQQPQGAKPQADAQPANPPVPAREESSVTDHTITIGSERISYQATAGTILIRDDKGDASASMFYMAYIRNDTRERNNRALAFLYNGGPGSSSVWLHMGAFGPRRVITADAEATPPAPYRVAENEYCLLDSTDLVFIDPVGTGFSRAVGTAKDKDFWGVDQDTKSVAQFISSYISRNGRWNSPKYLIGESYGTFRSAALSNYLQAHDGIDLNGIVLVSTVLNLGTISFHPGEDMPYIYYLPSYAATAWYHKMLKDRPADLSAFLDDARRFAATQYADALMKGAKISAAERAEAVSMLARFTGLSPEYLSRADLRVKLPQFMQELQRSRGLATGRLDARFSGPVSDLLSEYVEYDPQSTAVTGAFTAAFNSYVREELKFGQDKNYVILSEEAGRSWDWKHSTENSFGFPGAPNVEGDLVQAMITNPNLRIQVENGIYDLATPFFATEYTMDHLGLPVKLQGNIKMNYYDAGHMIYLRTEELAKLKKNVAAFIALK